MHAIFLRVEALTGKSVVTKTCDRRKDPDEGPEEGLSKTTSEDSRYGPSEDDEGLDDDEKKPWERPNANQAKRQEEMYGNSCRKFWETSIEKIEGVVVLVSGSTSACTSASLSCLAS